jgi:hypothetical protein
MDALAAKIIAAILLTLIKVGSGLLPMWLVSRNRSTTNTLVLLQQRYLWWKAIQC